MWAQAQGRPFVRLEHARALVEALDQGDEPSAVKCPSTLVWADEGRLMNELGELIRQLHEAVKEREVDDRLVELSRDALPGTGAQMYDVINRTERAAHRTPEAVEQAQPLAVNLNAQAHELLEKARHPAIPESMREFLARIFIDASATVDTVSSVESNLRSHGPMVTAAEGPDTLSKQDEVDLFLSRLGF